MSIQIQIVRPLRERAPMKINDMRTIHFGYKNIRSTLYKLRATDLVDKREDGAWFLNPGVTLGALITGKIPHRRITHNSQGVGRSLCHLFIRVGKWATYEQVSRLVRGREMRELSRLKEWLYRQRTKIRLEKERAERRQRKEQGDIQQKAEQPALFQF